jgi:hypothetical protein
MPALLQLDLEGCTGLSDAGAAEVIENHPQICLHAAAAHRNLPLAASRQLH